MSADPATADARKPGALDALAERFADVRVRTLLFAGLGGLAMLFVVLFERGADVGGLLAVVLGAAGLVLGWRGSPVFVLLILLYFLIFPYGLPPPEEDPFELAEGYFRVADLLLAASLVVYLSAHYRLLGITTQAMPADAAGFGRKAVPRKRPPELIRKGELARVLYLTGAVVLVGQIVWAVVTSLEVDVFAGFPLRFTDAPAYRTTDPGDLAAWRTRLVAVTGLLFFGTLLARLVFGYWRLRTLSPAEGAMLLMDAGWDETKRERVRVEGWRMWGVKKVADRVRAGRHGTGGKR
jgi:hypothetical protein